MRPICIKLVSGEEVIGLTESNHNDEYINLEDPVKIVHGVDEEGNYGIRFLSFMSYCENSLFTFRQRDVILYMSPTENMIGYYKDYMSRRGDPEGLETDELDIDDFVTQSTTLH